MSTRTVLIGVLGFVIGVPVSLGLISFVARVNRIPELTTATLDSAEQRWQQAKIVNYDATIEITGRRAGVVIVEVRQGEPVSLTRDGVTPKRVDTWQAWTVAGMLETLQLELELAETPQKAFGVPQRSQVVLRAEFDPEHGLPRRYQRVVMGADNELSWTVKAFTKR
jgi:hypothetical protein